METSNPADLEVGFGGVARNVALNLARLGVKSALAAAVGDDAAGDSLLGELKGAKVDVRRSIRMPSSPTSEYAAILRSDGNLAFGVVAAGQAEQAMDAGIGTILARVPKDSAIFADCNLGPGALHRVIRFARRTGRFLAVDAVSVRKVERLKPLPNFRGVSLLVLNRDEAIALGYSRLAPTRSLARWFRLLGAKMVVITRGSGYAVGADETGVFNQLPLRANVADVSGAGDCLTATLLWRLSQGDDLRQALRWGMVAAALTVEVSGSTNPALSPDFLAAAVSRIPGA
jgi:pseudouridine kinase